MTATVAGPSGRSPSVRAAAALAAALLAALGLSSGTASPAEASFRGENGAILVVAGDPPSLIALGAGGDVSPLGAGDEGAWSPLGSRIAFASGGDLFLAAADGSRRRAVTSGDTRDSHPSWSPDGGRIAFGRTGAATAGGGPDLRVLDLESGRVRALTARPGAEREPAWSPDGRSVLFATGPAGAVDLAIVEVRGGEVRSVTQLPGDERLGTWAPDGRRIAYVAAPPTGDAWRVEVLDLRSGATESLIVSDVEVAGLAWSPDGRALALAVGAGPSEVRVIEIATGASSTRWTWAERVGRVDWQPRCTVRGTAGGDVLAGTPGPDLVCGGGGRDRIRASGGRDVVFGGAGDDVLLGGAGDDVVVGGGGRDVVEGGTGADLIDVRDGARSNDAGGGGTGDDLCRRDRRDWCSPSGSAVGGRIFRIDDALRWRMARSWRSGCPVPLRDLRYLRLNHRRFDGSLARGELVVHERHARPILRAFRSILMARFPIARMRLVDDYEADDLRSMEANNTSAFNCRTVTGSSRWSEHAYGRAIDVNPVQNPYVVGDRVLPEAGESYVDRSRRAPGMIHAGDAVVRAFAAIGWEWGGAWRTAKDYQHFSSTGR